MKKLFSIAPVLVCGLGMQALAESWEVDSPNGSVHMSVQLAKPSGTNGYPKTKTRLYYRVEHGTGNDRSVVIGDSPLGLMLENQDFVNGLNFVSATVPSRLDEKYAMPHGKRHDCTNSANIMTLQFKNAKGGVMEVDVRAYNDGVAFRHRLTGDNTNSLTVAFEITGFAVPTDARLWMAPSDKPTVYAPAYETYYENGITNGTPSPTGMGWSFPALFRTANEKHWALLTEADVRPNYCGGRLSSSPTNGVYTLCFPNPAEGQGHGSAKPTSTLPWEMPWRVVILGGSPGDIAESTLVTDLNPPNAIGNTDWIRPGRVAWSWWSDQASPHDGAKQKRFVDFAAEMGWEYVLVDANWTIMDNGTIHDVIRYAKSKGVGILLWYNSGGPHNIVTEKPRDSLYYPEVRDFELKMLQEWGVKGIKVDFFQSDKQEVMALYHGIMKDAAKYKILVNFHGCTLPRGWARTYPNLISMEAVRGEENYIFDDKYPERSPVQNTITPFTRNVVGPMDYTPVGLKNNNYPHKSTYAHELALMALFETGWLHFADDPDSYRKLPEMAQQFMKEIPTAWDDTRYLSGYPGRHVVLARRSGNSWYLAGVNARNEPLTITLDLSKIAKSSQWQVTMLADGDTPQKFSADKSKLENNALKVAILPYGGFLAKLSPAP